MAPPQKKCSTPEEAAKLQKLRGKNRRAYQRKRESILARNRVTHEANKDRYNTSNALEQKDVRVEVKVAKGKYETVEENIHPTIEAMGGHFSGDGCVLSNTKVLGVFSMDRDTVKAYEGYFGGTVTKQGAGYYWRTRVSGFEDACRALAPFAWTKQPQLVEAISPTRSNEQLRKMKQEDCVIAMMVAGLDDEAFDKVISGFFTADGHCTNRHAKLSAYVVFGQKFRGILDAIANRYPGASAVLPYNPTANGSKVDRTGKNYNAFQLTFSGENALVLLRRIYPWIVSERVKSSVQKVILGQGQGVHR